MKKPWCTDCLVEMTEIGKWDDNKTLFKCPGCKIEVAI